MFEQLMLDSRIVERWKSRVLPSKTDDREHIVYWLYDSTCEAPDRDGYVGVTVSTRERSRFLEHKRSKRFQDFHFKVLIRGFAETCYLYEAVLRPYAGIGWNVAAGGALGRKLGVPKSEEVKRKIGWQIRDGPVQICPN
jgi:hypothetical protein